jgi:transcriptional regulator with XRE-family HTH domain
MVVFHGASHPQTLTEAVRARRIGLKMTLREFAKAIGRSIYSISEWENGHTNPRRSTRKVLVDWLGFDPEAARHMHRGR